MPKQEFPESLENWLTWTYRLLLAIVASGAMTWSAWVTMALTDRPDSPDVQRLIDTGDQRQDAELRHITDALRTNTSAIISLRIELAEMRAAINKQESSRRNQ